VSTNKWWEEADVVNPQDRRGWYDRLPEALSYQWLPDTFLVGGERCDGCPCRFSAGESFLALFRTGDGDPEAYCLDCAATVTLVGFVSTRRQRPGVRVNVNPHSPIGTGVPGRSAGAADRDPGPPGSEGGIT
jgi:hypothetical protein